jgi:hypothetical protein
MSEQPSPWSQSSTDVIVPAAPHSSPSIEAERGTVASGYRTGTVTRLNEPPPPPPADVIYGGPGDDGDDPFKRNRTIMRWFIAAAAAIVAVGLVVVLAMVMTGAGNAPGGLFDRRAQGPSDTRPELARRCPPPSEIPERANQPVPPPPPGPRTVDTTAGISYSSYPAPWSPWSEMWTGGELKVVYSIGQHFITEQNYSGTSDYHASILSGSVPATVNDAMVLDLKCTGQQVVADVRDSYYPKPNTFEALRDEITVLGGRPAWVSKFRLYFKSAGLKATDELVAVAMIDVGRPEAAILYISIPGTHKQFDWVVDDVINSVRPT